MMFIMAENVGYILSILGGVFLGIFIGDGEIRSESDGCKSTSFLIFLMVFGFQKSST